MDSVHEAHLERILENRRRRGVLAIYPNRRQSSACIKTESGDTRNMESQLPTKNDSDPGLHDVPGHVSDEKAVPRVSCLQTIQTVAESERSSVLGKEVVTERPLASEYMANGKAITYGTTLNSGRKEPHVKCGSSRGGKRLGGGRRWGATTLCFGRQSPSKFLAFNDGGRYNARSDRMFLTSRSPRRTVPLLTYSLPDVSLSFLSCGLKRGESWRRTPSPRVFRPALYGVRGVSQDWGVLSDQGGDSRFRSLSRPGLSENCVDKLKVWGRGSTLPSQRSTLAQKPLSGFADERRRQSAASVINNDDNHKSKGDSLAFPFPTMLPGFSLSDRTQVLGAQQNFLNSQNDKVGGVSSTTRAKLDINTSVSILAAGDWFYKWSYNGTSVYPRWLWVDLEKNFLFWAHRETYDDAFAGFIKLEKIRRVNFCEVEQRDVNGVLRTYYVLILETARRYLQLATELREKADSWHEALNHVVSYLKSHNTRTN